MPRHSCVLCLLFLALPSVRPAGAQPIEIVSTISPADASPNDLVGSSAGIVARWLEQFANKDRNQWSFRPSQPCGALDDAFKKTQVAVLTTSLCWNHVPRTDELRFSASIGVPVYVYALRENAGRGIYPNAEVAILLSAQPMVERIRAAFRTLAKGPVTVQVISGNTEAKLLEVLKSREYGLIAIPEDGSGTSVTAFLKAAANPSDPVEVSPALKAPLGPLEGTGPNAVRAFLLAPASVPQLVSVKPLVELPEALIFPLADANRSTRRDSPIRYAKFLPSSTIRAATLARSELPMRVVVPILITKGAVPEELWETFAKAQLAAPIDALVNPCDADSHYRSFLRSAIDVAKGESAREMALWEHAQILQSRGGSGKLAQVAARTEIERTATPANRDVIARQIAQFKSGTCELPWRALFRNDKLAYYQQGVNWLREALKKNFADPGDLQRAGQCLGNAFAEKEGAQPTCGEISSGSWTAYYAPYLATAVFQSGPK